MQQFVIILYIVVVVVTFLFNVTHSEYGVVGEDDDGDMGMIFLFALAMHMGLALLWPVYWALVFTAILRNKE